MTAAPEIETDVLVIGAGPAGLYQAFQLGLLGLRVDVVDALPFAGGQCVALYGDKPIYDIPGTPVCTGQQLVDRLLQQASPFVADRLRCHAMVTGMHAQADGRWRVSASSPHDPTRPQGQWLARGVVVATGAGAFLPRTLIPGLLGLRGVSHHVERLTDWVGQDLVVAGGGDEALQTALDLLALPPHQAPASITLLHRRDQFQAAPVLVDDIRAALRAQRLRLVVGVPTGFDAPDGQLHGLTLLGPDSQPFTLTCPHLLVQLGLSPKLGPLQDWGMALQRKQVSVDVATFATNLPGVHAIGDAVAYPGKLRLIACGFHEATLAAHALASRLNPSHPAQLQYTSSSAVLQGRLGIV